LGNKIGIAYNSFISSLRGIVDLLERCLEVGVVLDWVWWFFDDFEVDVSFGFILSVVEVFNLFVIPMSIAVDWL